MRLDVFWTQFEIARQDLGEVLLEAVASGVAAMALMAKLRGLEDAALVWPQFPF